MAADRDRDRDRDTRADRREDARTHDDRRHRRPPRRKPKPPRRERQVQEVASIHAGGAPVELQGSDDQDQDAAYYSTGSGNVEPYHWARETATFAHQYADATAQNVNAQPTAGAENNPT